MKDIKGYEGLYAITEDGKVWSYRRKIFLKGSKDRDGYHRVNLQHKGKVKTVFVHRLVAEAYIPNPENKPQVNHLDEDKQCNNVNNLAWATAQENVNWGTRNARAGVTIKAILNTPVRCVELDRIFESQKEAAEVLSVDQGGISRCINGKQCTAGGFHWERVEGAQDEE